MIVAKQLTKIYKKTIPKKVVLDGVSFSINSGEKVAIVGKNGTGKTTLLRLISGSLEKTFGDLEVSGNVYPLMSIGLGVNEKFTGRENIGSSLVYNGFDLSKSTVKAIEKDVEDFTEFGHFLDRPFYTYSLGMKMRLMFAIATAVKPEIFLIDEILGAGDYYFTLKSQNRLNKMIDSMGSTLLLVSHATQLLKRFCDRGIWIKDGKVFLDSDINTVCLAYDAYMARLADGTPDNFQSLDELTEKTSAGHRFYPWQDDKAKITIKDFQLSEEKDDVRLCLLLSSNKKEAFSIRILFTLWEAKGHRIARFENDFNIVDFRENSTSQVIAILKKSHLPTGSFEITASIYKKKKCFSEGDKGEKIYIASRIGVVNNCANTIKSVNTIPHVWSIK